MELGTSQLTNCHLLATPRQKTKHYDAALEAYSKHPSDLPRIPSIPFPPSGGKGTPPPSPSLGNCRPWAAHLGSRKQAGCRRQAGERSDLAVAADLGAVDHAVGLDRHPIGQAAVAHPAPLPRDDGGGVRG